MREKRTTREGQTPQRERSNGEPCNAVLPIREPQDASSFAEGKSLISLNRDVMVVAKEIIRGISGTYFSPYRVPLVGAGSRMTIGQKIATIRPALALAVSVERGAWETAEAIAIMAYKYAACLKNDFISA